MIGTIIMREGADGGALGPETETNEASFRAIISVEILPSLITKQRAKEEAGTAKKCVFEPRQRMRKKGSRDVFMESKLFSLQCLITSHC